MTSAEIERLVKEGIAAIRAGDKSTGRAILQQVVAQDQLNEQAWLWLSAAVDTDEERIICLENALTVNPDNEAAQRGLAKLKAAQPPPPKPSPPPAPPTKPMNPPLVESPFSPSFPDPPLPVADTERNRPTSVIDYPKEKPASSAATSVPAATVQMAGPDAGERDLLDLFDAWVAAIIFRQGPTLEEMEVASFGRVVLDIVIALMIAGLGTFLRGMLSSYQASATDMQALQEVVTQLNLLMGSSVNPDQFLTSINAFSAVSAVVGVLFSLLVANTISHIVAASIMGGRGSYVQTLHALGIAQVAYQIVYLIPSILGLFVPILSAIMGVGMFIYGIILDVLALTAAHEGFDIGKAIGTLIISFIILTLLACSLGSCFFFALASMGSS